MHRRLCLALCTLGVSASTVAVAGTHPNVLVIVADDVGVDKLRSYLGDFSDDGGDADQVPDTPNLELLGQVGLRFTAAAAQPVCSPTRASLLTGMHPSHLGIGMPIPLAPDLATTTTTLAELFRDAGYATALFGKWHLGYAGTSEDDWAATGGGGPTTINQTAPPLSHGFGAYAGSLGGEVEDYTSWTRVSGTTSGSATIQTSTVYPTDLTETDAAAWIAARTGPWFAVVAFNAAHTDEEGAGGYEADDASSACAAVHDPSDAAQAAYMRALVECMDKRIGTLLGEHKDDTLKDTIIVFVGDNGTEKGALEGSFANADGRATNGKTTAYETGIHVPLLVADGTTWNQAKDCLAEQGKEIGDCTLSSTNYVKSPGRTVTAPVGVVDLFATITGLAGLTVPSDTDSVSFSRCLKLSGATCSSPSAGTPKYVWSETFQCGNSHNPSCTDASLPTKAEGALRRGNKKLVVRLDTSTGTRCLTYELYDVSPDHDPYEHDDLIESTAAGDKKARHDLKRHLTDMSVFWMSGLSTCSG